MGMPIFYHFGQKWLNQIISVQCIYLFFYKYTSPLNKLKFKEIINQEFKACQVQPRQKSMRWAAFKSLSIYSMTKMHEKSIFTRGFLEKILDLWKWQNSYEKSIKNHFPILYIDLSPKCIIFNVFMGYLLPKI